MTAPGGFTAGDVLSAADMNALPGGVKARAVITAPQGGITTVADITGLTVTWTATANRLYRISAYALILGNVVDDEVYCDITDGSNAVQQRAADALNGAAATARVFNPVVTQTGLSGSVTRKIRVTRQAGSGSLQVAADGVTPAWIMVEDLGLAP